MSDKEIEDKIVEEKLEGFKKHYYKNRHNEELARIKQKKPKIITTAKKLVEKFYRESNISVAPRSVYAAAMYVSCKIHRHKMVQTKMAKYFDTNVVSIRRAGKELVGEDDYKKLLKLSYEA